ncbi:hypothetical protein [Actinacidiphila acididurans]|uniref:Uncharacterized protein n=1 Tax=Actinacidiphila acididurans TaxID=2784346 RepID=A0ABS2TVH1_9ACTN|nr:hypothetical protein [Actinacidiphila acididurans]MBM9506797.1 hypothetical protein [Actinacidiphila acididurans]
MPPRDKAGRDHGNKDQVADSAPVDVQAVADELYTAPPGGFTALRDEKAADARRAGDRDAARAIAALRKPSLSAWASNLLVRRRPDDSRAFLELGEALRQAHGELDAERMRELSGQQWRVISALSRQATRLAADTGHPLSQTVQREVESTLRTVVADPDAAQQWATGTLTTPLTPPSAFTPTGGGRTGAAPAPAPSPAGPAPGRDRRRRRPDEHEDELAARRHRQHEAELERARQALTDAGAQVHERQVAQREARKAHDRARAARERADRKVRELHEQVRQAEDDAESATWQDHEAEDELHAADQALARAEADLQEARQDVERMSASAT